ncbi:hypothetical protein BDZ45DRAFT_606264 [Acephala macrosclerotiorum]|nr:hypothetical protein BDZ45DRAFT_606264 [Acephala macrosclerotiorum]
MVSESSLCTRRHVTSTALETSYFTRIFEERAYSPTTITCFLRRNPIFKTKKQFRIDFTRVNSIIFDIIKL